MTLSDISNNSNVRKGALLVVIFLVGLATGRYTLPAKIVTKTEIQTVTKVVKDTTQDKKDNTVTTITETKKPDGSVVTQTQIVDKNQTDTKTDVKTDKDMVSKSSETETRDVNQLGVNGLVGLRVGAGESLTYGVSVQRKLLGPVEIGAFGFTDRLVGFSLGLRF